MEEFRPPRSNNKARNLTLIFIVAAFAIFFICALFKEMPLRWAFQLISIVIFTAGVYMVARYLTKNYIYRIDGDDLTITEISGRRQTCVCRIAISGVKNIALVDYTTDEGTALAKELKKKKTKRFDYRVDLSPARFIVIETDEGYENSTIYVSYEEKLRLSLKRTYFL